jgi:hypothetical protein
MRPIILAAAMLFLAPLSAAATDVFEAPDSSVVASASAVTDTSLASQVPQRDVFDLLNQYILKRRVEPGVKFEPKTGLSWAILPTFSYNPVYGFAIGAMATGAGQRGSTKARFSSLSLSGNISTTGQVQAQVRGDVFSPSGNYLTKMDFRYLDTERSTWGLGPISSDQQEYPMKFQLYRAYATVYRVASGPVFVGLGYHYDVFANIDDTRAVF